MVETRESYYPLDCPTKDDFDEIPSTQMDDIDVKEMINKNWTPINFGQKINYRQSWGVWHGFREFVQNSLDETGKCDIFYDSDNKISYVQDNGKGFVLHNLLLGEEKGATEQERHCLRGRYGEGMKIAALPFFRANCKVFIRTVNIDVVFAMAPITIMHQSALVSTAFVRPNQHKQGTCVGIENFDCRPFLHRFTPNLPEELILLTIKGGDEEYDDCKVRQILDLPGDIYVRDIYVQTLNDAYFGYNFWFNDSVAALDPDRARLKDTWRIWKEFIPFLKSQNKEFFRVFFQTISKPRLAKDPYITEINRPERSFEWLALDGQYDLKDYLTKKDAQILHEVFIEMAGSNNYSWSKGDNKDAKVLEHLGIVDLHKKVPEMMDLMSHYSFIKTPNEWRRLKELDKVTELKMRKVLETISSSLGEEKAEEVAWNIKTILNALNVFAKEIVGDNHPVLLYFSEEEGTESKKVGGFYRAEKIYIHVRQLNNSRSLYRTLIHEMAHANCEGCEDITEKFENSLDSVAVTFFELANNDDFKRTFQQLEKAINNLDLTLEDYLI